MKILVFSDIHSDLKRLERLLDTKADYYFCAGDLVSWSRGLMRAGEVLAKKASQVYVMPGNHESASQIADLCKRFGFSNFHAKHARLDGVAIAGLGYSSPTPFNTPGEYTEEQLAEQLSQFDAVKPRVLICHCPPKNSLLDQAGPGEHFGSNAVRECLERLQPDYFFCGHIHEAEGVEERFGKTLGVNVGKKGYLLDLSSLK